MSILSIIILVIIVIAVFLGIRHGFVRQLGGIIGLLLGIYLSYKFSAAVADWLHNSISASRELVKVLSFVLIMVVTIICMSLLGRFFEKILKLSLLGWLNNLLGALFSVVIALLVTGLFLRLFRFIDAHWFPLFGEQIKASSLASSVLRFTDIVFPYLRNIF